MTLINHDHDPDFDWVTLAAIAFALGYLIWLVFQ